MKLITTCRDIKPENLLIGNDDEIKMSDFGWAVEISDENAQKRMTLCGTADYLVRTFRAYYRSGHKAAAMRPVHAAQLHWPCQHQHANCLCVRPASVVCTRGYVHACTSGVLMKAAATL